MSIFKRREVNKVGSTIQLTEVGIIFDKVKRIWNQCAVGSGSDQLSVQ